MKRISAITLLMCLFLVGCMQPSVDWSADLRKKTVPWPPKTQEAAIAKAIKYFDAKPGPPARARYVVNEQMVSAIRGQLRGEQAAKVYPDSKDIHAGESGGVVTYMITRGDFAADDNAAYALIGFYDGTTAITFIVRFSRRRESWSITSIDTHSVT